MENWNFMFLFSKIHNTEVFFLMKTCSILLSSINDVKNFVNIVSRFDYDIDLASGRYVVDAKSIMGIFSLDLSKPIAVEVHNDGCDDLMEALKPYIQ